MLPKVLADYNVASQIPAITNCEASSLRYGQAKALVWHRNPPVHILHSLRFVKKLHMGAIPPPNTQSQQVITPHIQLPAKSETLPEAMYEAKKTPSATNPPIKTQNSADCSLFWGSRPSRAHACLLLRNRHILVNYMHVFILIQYTLCLFTMFIFFYCIF